MKLPTTWQVPRELRLTLRKQQIGQQRVCFSEGHLVLVLAEAPTSQTRQRSDRIYWRDDQDQWKVSGHGSGLPTLAAQVNTFEETVTHLLSAYDAANTVNDYFQIKEQMTRLRQIVREMHETFCLASTLVPELEVLTTYREQSAALHRALESLHEDTTHAIELCMARTQEAQAKLTQQSIEVSQRLNVIAAIFLPITAMASLFGMNLMNGLENTHALLFWLMTIVGLVLGFMLRGWVLRGKGESLRDLLDMTDA